MHIKIIAAVIIFPCLLFGIYCLMGSIAIITYWGKSGDDSGASIIFLIMGAPGIALGCLYGCYQFVSQLLDTDFKGSIIKSALLVYGYTFIGWIIALVLFYGYLWLNKFIHRTK